MNPDFEKNNRMVTDNTPLPDFVLILPSNDPLDFLFSQMQYCSKHGVACSTIILPSKDMKNIKEMGWEHHCMPLSP